MRENVKKLIQKYFDENDSRSKKMNSGTCSDYEHTVLVHQYNLTLKFIKELEKL